jgi:glycosyltransferase involved in cell wall biosynthesis
MNISVLIPAYNSEATVQATLDSALSQTVAPGEILVMDDGSTDQTSSILKSYGSKITAFRQPNKGVVEARNELCRLAKGELIAFLDSDDLWHPQYVETQLALFSKYPNAAGFFTGHKDIQGYGDCEWDSVAREAQSGAEVIGPLAFFKQYNAAPGRFNMSFCCVPRPILKKIGRGPFKAGKSGVAEDCYFHNLLPLWGPLIYAPAVLAAYRMTPGSLSSSRLRQTAGEVEAFELLESSYDNAADSKLARAFRMGFASKRRSHAKILMGAGRTSEAREQFRRSWSHGVSPHSLTKSLALLLLSHMPSALQPKWPSVHRGSEHSGVV